MGRLLPSIVMSSLFARLENVARQLPESHIPSLAQLPRLAGAILLFLEHGDDLLEAAETDEGKVHALLTELAQAENQRVADEQGQPPQQPQATGGAQAFFPAPAQAGVTAQPAPAPQPQASPVQQVPGGHPSLPAQPGGVAAGGFSPEQLAQLRSMFGQPDPDTGEPGEPDATEPDQPVPQSENPTMAELVAQVQSLQAQLARERGHSATITSSPAQAGTGDPADRESSVDSPVDSPAPPAPGGERA